MKLGIFIRIFFCILSLAGFLYSYINKQNDITELRLQIPIEEKELQATVQENVRLQYEVDSFENPEHLMQLARKPEFSHLKHPLLKDIIEIEEK